MRTRWRFSGSGSWVVPADDEKRVGLYGQLLELNARELVHGSYGLEGDHIVWTDTLELENLDFSEFEASYDSVSLALALTHGLPGTIRRKVISHGDL